MNQAKVMEVLRQVEWGTRGMYVAACPCCREFKRLGHADDCKLAALLDEATEELEHKRCGHARIALPAAPSML